MISEELSKVIGVNSRIENDVNENKEEKELKLNLNENLNFENMMPNSQNINLGYDNNIWLKKNIFDFCKNYIFTHPNVLKP